MRSLGRLLRAEELPVLLHQFEIGWSQSRSDIDFSVRNPFIDFQLGDNPAVHKYEEVTAAMFHADRVEREAAVVIQNEEGAVGAIGCLIGRESHDVEFTD